MNTTHRHPPPQTKRKSATTLKRLKDSWKSASLQPDWRKQRSSMCGFYRADNHIPPIVEQTCKYLERNALQQEGIFRVSGSQEDVRRIKDKYDKGKKVDIFKEENVHTVAGVLKLFFTELSNPVLSHELYPSFMAAVGFEDPLLRVWCVRKTIATLPPGNRAVIDRVCAMFSIISHFEEDNKMTAKNIALVMNPSMFRDKDGSVREFVTTGGLRVRLLELLTVHYKDLFVTPEKELEIRVKCLEESITLETQQKLKEFSNILKEGAILLASNLLNEGETELTVQFDNADTFAPPPQLPTDEEVKSMSFEEFSAHIALHPPGGVQVSELASSCGRRSGMRFGVINKPPTLSDDVPVTNEPETEPQPLTKCPSLDSIGKIETTNDDFIAALSQSARATESSKAKSLIRSPRERVKVAKQRSLCVSDTEILPPTMNKKETKKEKSKDSSKKKVHLRKRIKSKDKGRTTSDLNEIGKGKKMRSRAYRSMSSVTSNKVKVVHRKSSSGGSTLDLLGHTHEESLGKTWNDCETLE